MGIHIETTEGWLSYETVYGGNWWLNDGASQAMIDGAPHTGDGQGSQYYGTLEEWAAAFPDLEVVGMAVLYTNEVPASVTLTSVKIGCVEYTFDYAAPGQGGGTTNGDTTIYTPTITPLAAQTSVLPAAIPATGGTSAGNPLMILLAALATYGAVYFAQPKRRTE